MSYYVKVGDETTEIPKCCDECYMRQNRFEICESCSLLDQYNGGYFSLTNLVPKKEYYCAADCNRTIHDISKKPEWCPIQDVRNNCIYTEFDKELDEKIKRFIPRNGEIE